MWNSLHLSVFTSDSASRCCTTASNLLEVITCSPHHNTRYRTSSQSSPSSLELPYRLLATFSDVCDM